MLSYITTTNRNSFPTFLHIRLLLRSPKTKTLTLTLTSPFCSDHSSPEFSEEAKMVLAQLGTSISRALQQMSNATIIDEKVLNECLNEITRALLQSDVQFKLVRDMQTNIKKIVNLDDLAAGHNKRKIIQQVQISLFSD